MIDSEMMNDIVKGLKNLNTVREKKSRKLKRQLKGLPWLYLSIILILIIILISFLVIKKHLDSEKPPANVPVKKEMVFSKNLWQFD